jgi:hypothetical protein
MESIDYFPLTLTIANVSATGGLTLHDEWNLYSSKQIVEDRPCSNSFMDGKAPEALSPPPSLVDDSESLGGTPRDSLCPDTPCFKSLTYAETQSADHASRLFPDNLVGDQRQGSGEVFCPPPKLSSVGIEHSISPGRFFNTAMKPSITLRKLTACR